MFKYHVFSFPSLSLTIFTSQQSTRENTVWPLEHKGRGMYLTWYLTPFFMLSLNGSLLNLSLGKCSQWPDFGLHYKNFLLTPFSFDSEQRWGWGRFREQSWLLLYRIGCVCFQVGPLGKCSSESSLRVSDGKGYVLYILPVKAQTMCENSSGESHGARGSWKLWFGNC